MKFTLQRQKDGSRLVGRVKLKEQMNGRGEECKNKKCVEWLNKVAWMIDYGLRKRSVKLRFENLGNLESLKSII